MPARYSLPGRSRRRSTRAPRRRRTSQRGRCRSSRPGRAAPGARPRCRRCRWSAVRTDNRRRRQPIRRSGERRGECSDHIGNTEPARVMHVQRETIDRHRGGDQRAHRGDIDRSRHADRVGDAHLGHTACHEVRTELDDARRCDVSFEGTAEAHGDRNINRAPALAGQLDDMRDVIERTRRRCD